MSTTSYNSGSELGQTSHTNSDDISDSPTEIGPYHDDFISWTRTVQVCKARVTDIGDTCTLYT